MGNSLVGKPSVGAIDVGGSKAYNNISFVSSDSSVDISNTNGTIDFKAVGGGGGTGYNVSYVTLTGTDITNKYIILPTAPTVKGKTTACLISVGQQNYTADFVVTTDDSDKRLSWDGLGLESLLEAGDILLITYV